MVLIWLNNHLYLSFSAAARRAGGEGPAGDGDPPTGAASSTGCATMMNWILRGLASANKRGYPHLAPDKSMSVYQRRTPKTGADAGRRCRRIAFTHAILLALPGVPVMRYGDEIGMGDDLSLPRCAVNADTVVGHGQRRLFPGGVDDLPETGGQRFRYQRINVETALRHPPGRCCIGTQYGIGAHGIY